jgi:hypothetical protein
MRLLPASLLHCCAHFQQLKERPVLNSLQDKGVADAIRIFQLRLASFASRPRGLSAFDVQVGVVRDSSFFGLSISAIPTIEGLNVAVLWVNERSHGEGTMSEGAVRI